MKKINYSLEHLTPEQIAKLDRAADAFERFLKSDAADRLAEVMRPAWEEEQRELRELVARLSDDAKQWILEANAVDGIHVQVAPEDINSEIAAELLNEGILFPISDGSYGTAFFRIADLASLIQQ